MDGPLTRAAPRRRPPAGERPAGGLAARRPRLAVVLALAGATVLAYLGVLLVRGDPLTAGYNAWEQRRLEELLTRAGTSSRVAGEATAPVVRAFASALEPGEPVGRIRVPTLGLDRVVVYGTGRSELAKGPGLYEQASLPGAGRTAAIAGHRTTFGAPFRHIDDLAPGDAVVLELRYGTFRYVVFDHEVVANDDWSVLRDRGSETLVLTACHPLYGSSHRWVVYARRADEARLAGHADASHGQARTAAR